MYKLDDKSERKYEIELVETIDVSNVCEFAYRFDLEDEIKKDYNVNKVFDTVMVLGISDSEVIEEMLNKYCKYYFLYQFNEENCGSFRIYLFDIMEKK